MKYILICSLTFLVLSTSGQNKVSLDELKSYIGKIVEVRGKVFGISKIGKHKDIQAIIFVGGVSPNEKLSVVVKKIIEGESDYILKEKKFINSIVIVKGKVDLLKGKPSISVDSSDDLSFMIDEEVSNF